MKRCIFSTLVCLASLSFIAIAQETEQKKDSGEFSRLTIDLGVVVSDIDAAIEFYTEVVGFQETGGFGVEADFAKYAGLTDGKSLDIKVLKLGNGPGATSLKLMEVEGESAKADHSYIESTLGVSYLTITVQSMDRAMERIRKAGIEPVANGPATIPGTKMDLTIIRDPDGNMIELVGPASAK